MPRAVERPHLRAQPQAVGILQAEAHDHEIEITVGDIQQRPGRVRLPLHILLLMERPHDALGGALAILDQQDAAVAPGFLEPRAHGRGEAHLLLRRGAHQHLVGQELEPRQVLDSGDEGKIVDRFGEEVVGTGLEPLHPVPRLIERRHHDDRNMLRARLGLEPAANLEPVHAGHHHVEQDDVSSLARADLERLRTAARRAHFEILGREPRFEQLEIGRDIVDHENASSHIPYRASPINCLTVSRNIDTEIGFEI